MPEHTTINIIHKEDEGTDVEVGQNASLNLNLDNVEVKTARSFIDLSSVVDDDSDIKLEDSELENIGDGNLRLTLECGDDLIFNAEKMIASLLKAVQLPVAKDE